MNIEFTGKVSEVLPLQSGMGQRGPWSRATVVFEIQNGRYSQKIACENTADAEKFSKLMRGQTVSVKADVFSREYNGKWYSSILCYEFSPQGEYAAPAAGTPEPF